MASFDYDLAVLGGGAAGLTAAGIAGNAGVKTLLVERARLGGDCTWTGCIPSKALLHSAHVAHTVRTAARAGLAAPEPEVDFAAVMRRLRRLREAIYQDADAPAIYEGYGIEVVRAGARFADAHTLVLDAEDGERRITAARFVLATGGRPAVPPIPGLDAVPYLTSETLFEIETRPRRMAVIGGGPIGAEMAQAFQRLGTQVTILDQASRLLARDDAGHAAILLDVLRAEGVRFVGEASVERVARRGDGTIEVHARAGGRALVAEADALLMATGRTPNVEGLGLDAAGLRYGDEGIVVDDRCRTSRRHVWAAGDCTGEYQLTHMSEHMAKVAVTNAVLRLPLSIDRAHVPWVTYTDPEVAQLGKTEAQLREVGAAFEVYRFPYARIDRAVTDGATTGQIKVMATRWCGTILGVSVIGERAGEVVGLYAVAMRNGVSLRQVADTVFPYPTYALGARRAADQWYVRKQYPGAIRLLQKAFGYRGTVPPLPDPDRVV